MSEPSMNSLSNNEQKEDVKRPSSQAAGVVGDRVRPFSGLAGSMMTGTSAVFAKFAKQILFVLAVIIGAGAGAVWYYKSSHPTSMPAKPLASTSAATGSPKDLGAQGDNGKAPAPTPAAPASTPIPDQATPPNPKAPPLDGTVQLPPPPSTASGQAGQPPAQAPVNRLDATFFTDGQQQSSSGSSFGAGASTINPALTANLQGAGQKSGEFTGNLNPTATAKAQASMIGNRSLLLAKGTLIDCVLNTALTSGVPGMASCTTSKPVYSDNGKTLLIERGSTISGEFNGQMKTGQSRMYVLWTRLKTPKGVIVNLDSPGADALGRPGLSGEIDKHWWERIGSAFMLSLVQDAIGYAATRGANNNNGASQMYFQNTQQSGENMAAAILKETISIPPTLSKNQGDRVTVYVARDVDFSNVYQVTPTP